MFDIMAIAAEDIATLHLKSAAGDELYAQVGEERHPVTITFFGPGTTDHARATQRYSDKLTRRAQKGGKVKLPTPDEQRADRADLLAALTVSFNNIDYAPGKDLQGFALHHAFFNDARLGFIADQANAFVGDWERFTPGSVTN